MPLAGALAPKPIIGRLLAGALVASTEAGKPGAGPDDP